MSILYNNIGLNYGITYFCGIKEPQSYEIQPMEI